MFQFRLNHRRYLTLRYKRTKIVHGDSRDYLKTLPESSVDSIVTDIPYAIGLMKKAWDRRQAPMAYQLWNESWAVEAIRVLKPGAHMAVFMSPVTMHRAVCGLEDAGFEIRDLCLYLHSMGLPKGYDIAQCIEKLKTTGKARRPDRELGLTRNRWNGGKKGLADTGGIVELTYEDAIKWTGWNSQLKPAMECCYLFRKPLSESNVASNILKWGTGGINAGICRVPDAGNKRTVDGSSYPSNVLHDGRTLDPSIQRYYYCAKPHKGEKHIGCVNTHPTVKPLKLMQYYARLITPPDGLIVDPFAGSFTTGIAALLDNFRFLGIDQEKEYVDIGERRMAFTESNLENVRKKYGIP